MTSQVFFEIWLCNLRHLTETYNAVKTWVLMIHSKQPFVPGPQSNISIKETFLVILENIEEKLLQYYMHSDVILLVVKRMHIWMFFSSRNYIKRKQWKLNFLSKIINSVNLLETDNGYSKIYRVICVLFICVLFICVLFIRVRDLFYFINLTKMLVKPSNNKS